MGKYVSSNPDGILMGFFVHQNASEFVKTAGGFELMVRDNGALVNGLFF